VELPTSSPGRGAANDVATEVPWRGAGLVLVVDDSDEVRELVGRVLERMGFEVCYASDGVDALAVAGRTATRLACVLLDLTMPRLGGLGALAELKRVAPEVPVVLMSGYPSDTLEEADVRRADGFIAKPFTLAAIREAMQSVLAARAR
jgi:CheY-like chemotaxis protein